MDCRNPLSCPEPASSLETAGIFGAAALELGDDLGSEEKDDRGDLEAQQRTTAVASEP
jgi:hypothetical protein